MLENLAAFGLSHPFLIYFVIIVVAIIEGPFLSLFLGGLLFTGYFKVLPVYFSLMFADLLGDALWYGAGYYYGHGFVSRFGRYLKITEDHITRIKELFNRKKNHILFFSKLTNGLGFPGGVLFTAGLSKIPFGSYMLINLYGQIIWSGVLLATGYFFSNLYLEIDNFFGRLSLIILAIIILIVIIMYRKSVNKKIDN